MKGVFVTSHIRYFKDANKSNYQYSLMGNLYSLMKKEKFAYSLRNCFYIFWEISQWLQNECHDCVSGTEKMRISERGRRLCSKTTSIPQLSQIQLWRWWNHLWDDICKLIFKVVRDRCAKSIIKEWKIAVSLTQLRCIFPLVWLI